MTRPSKFGPLSRIHTGRLQGHRDWVTLQILPGRRCYRPLRNRSIIILDSHSCAEVARLNGNGRLVTAHYPLVNDVSPMPLPIEPPGGWDLSFTDGIQIRGDPEFKPLILAA